MQTLSKKRKRIGPIVLAVCIVVLTLVNLSPFLWILFNSFRPESESFASSVLPRHWTIASYYKVLVGGDMQTANTMHVLFNSFVVSSLSTVFSSLLSISAAYGFSRFRFKGRSFLMAFLMNLRTFPSILLAIALFSMAGKLGLYNTFFVLIIANAMLNLPFATWNNISILDAVPISLDESAMIDGLRRLPALFRIVLPVAAPGLAGTTAYTFILSWNEYLFATNFISSPEKQLITTRIASAVTQTNTDYGALMATAMLASLPLIAMFLVIQKYIIQGMSAGSVKG